MNGITPLFEILYKYGIDFKTVNVLNNLINHYLLPIF